MTIDTVKKLRLIEERSTGFEKIYSSCGLCVRKCGVNRKEGEKGYCGAGKTPVVYSYGPHHGEEPVISGKNGSGTIFFSHCGMKCVYCQNHKFSQSAEGKEISARDLTGVMLSLQEKACHNINLVSPTHYVPVIIKALAAAYGKGLNIPLVYNTGGYDSVELVRLLEGIVDIYLPDMRYSDDRSAVKYSDSPGYVRNNRAIVKEMFSQVGNIRENGGIAETGLLIRLLVLPEGISGTEDTIGYIAGNISKDTWLSVMSQYYPAYLARGIKELARRITVDEMAAVERELNKTGLDNGWIQPLSSDFDPDFSGENFKPNI